MSESKIVAIKAKEDRQTAVEEAEDYVENFDILETITNVGNDEVFTPVKIAKQMLDSLPDEVWHNPNYKWLNPCTKNGVFEREIAIRLNEGLKDVILDEESRKKHILQNMIYAIGLTKFCSHVARRTLYYCSQANKKCDGIKAEDGHYINGYAIGNGTWFNDEEGNIKTPCTNHEFVGKGKERKCKFCGIKEDSKYNDPLQREQYAYEFMHVHHLSLERHLRNRFFGGNKDMKFDIIIGNPPYQLSDGGAHASARPIYNLFVKTAKSLNPKYLCMIIPSRWMVTGKGLDDFREEMIRDKHIIKLYDFFNSKDAFPNVDIKGGVCYFLREREREQECEIHNISNGNDIEEFRYLDSGTGVFIRNENLVRILKKVKIKTKLSFMVMVSARMPYGLSAETMYNASKFKLPEFSKEIIDGGYRVFGIDEKQHRLYKYVPNNYPLPKKSSCLNKYAVFIAKSYGCGSIGEVPSTPVLSTPVLSTPGDLCTETFLEIGPFETEIEGKNCIKYIYTKLFRCLVGILKTTQHGVRRVYEFVPMQDFSSSSDIDWSKSIKEIDQQLYKKYNLSDEDINFIEENIKEM